MSEIFDNSAHEVLIEATPEQLDEISSTVQRIERLDGLLGRDSSTTFNGKIELSLGGWQFAGSIQHENGTGDYTMEMYPLDGAAERSLKHLSYKMHLNIDQGCMSGTDFEWGSKNINDDLPSNITNVFNSILFGRQREHSDKLYAARNEEQKKQAKEAVNEAKRIAATLIAQRPWIDWVSRTGGKVQSTTIYGRRITETYARKRSFEEDGIVIKEEQKREVATFQATRLQRLLGIEPPTMDSGWRTWHTSIYTTEAVWYASRGSNSVGGSLNEIESYIEPSQLHFEEAMRDDLRKIAKKHS